MQSNIVRFSARNPVTHLPVQRVPRSNEDPIFPIIEHHRALSAAYDAAVAHPGVGDDSPEFKAQNDLTDRACTMLLDHSDTLFSFRPHTADGLVAMFEYLPTLEEWQLPRGMDDTHREWFGPLCGAVAGSIKGFAKAIARVQS